MGRITLIRCGVLQVYCLRAVLRWPLNQLCTDLAAGAATRRITSAAKDCTMAEAGLLEGSDGRESRSASAARAGKGVAMSGHFDLAAGARRLRHAMQLGSHGRFSPLRGACGK